MSRASTTFFALRYRLTLLGAVVLVGTPRALALEEETLEFGSRSSNEGLRMNYDYFANCFSTDGAVVVTDLSWSTYWAANTAYFSTK